MCILNAHQMQNRTALAGMYLLYSSSGYRSHLFGKNLYEHFRHHMLISRAMSRGRSGNTSQIGAGPVTAY
jgi:hypothetical protein